LYVDAPSDPHLVDANPRGNLASLLPITRSAPSLVLEILEVQTEAIPGASRHSFLMMAAFVHLLAQPFSPTKRFGRLSVQKMFCVPDELTEDGWWRQVEPFDADVLPLQTGKQSNCPRCLLRDLRQAIARIRVGKLA
jgi:hypothetical protein